jgi:hypothetical protein
MNYILKTILILSTLIGFQLRSHNNILGSHLEYGNLTVIHMNCDKGNPNQEKVNDTILIGYKQTYHDFENAYSLELDSILEDSRCPIGLECDWEGNAAVRLNLNIGRKKHSIILNTNRMFATDTVIENINFILAGLIPYPQGTTVIDNKDYIAKIKAEKQ